MNDFSLGKIPNSIITEEYKNLNYINEPFNDQGTLLAWQETYGNIFSTGDLVDFRHYQPIWINDIKKYFSLKKCSFSFYRMNPGNILPYHQDTYSKYMKVNNIDDINKICRAIIFLEDWKPGHYFEIADTPIINYRSGDYVLWKSTTPHMAANLGKTNRFTLQLTGINNHA